jgi:trimethylamine--corrinoid protein Co-methyltransferase
LNGYEGETMPDSKIIPHQLSILNEEDIDNIHAATLEVLSETGACYESPEVISLLMDAGAQAEDDGRVRLPPELVEWAIGSAPSQLTLYARGGQPAVKLAPSHVYCGTGSDCPYVIDGESGKRRAATRSDVATFARLSDGLDNIDFVLSMALASDVPSGTADLHHFREMVANTTKPVVFTVIQPDNMQPIVGWASQIAGGADRLQERPFVAHFGMPSPPLRHGKNALRNLTACARHRLPVIYASGTQVGMTGPMSLSGSTVSSNCDVLSGLVVHQLTNPGAPFIYGVCVAPFDMQTSTEAYGAPEHYPGDLINVRVAQRYGLPTWGYAGSTDAKTLDHQAALEYLGSTLMGMLSGCNLLHDVGYLESGLTASCESIVFGDLVVAFARRILGPVRAGGESLAVDVIRRVGPGGTFLMEAHTLAHMRRFWYSPLIDRQRYDAWTADGSQTLSDRVRTETQRILDSHQPEALDPALLKEIDRFIAARDQVVR